MRSEKAKDGEHSAGENSPPVWRLPVKWTYTRPPSACGGIGRRRVSLPSGGYNQTELANTKQDADTLVTRVQGQYREEDRSFHRKVRCRSGSCAQSANPTSSWWGLRVAMIRESVKRTSRTKVNGLGDMRREDCTGQQPDAE